MMKKKNFNTRTCLITRKKFHKSELIRICIVNQKIIVDLDKKIESRGYYIHKQCNLDLTIIIKKIENITKHTIDNDEIMKLEKQLNLGVKNG